jgi:uncharacterized protein YjdB
MKKSSILLLIISTLLLNVCTVDEIVSYGSISGVVKDAQTQQPLENVSVTLKPGGLTKATGKDGSYSFEELEAQEYTLTYTKPEYITTTKESTVQARANNIVDITLAPEPVIPILKTNVKSLDFGKDSETLSLEITNTGKGSLDWHIEHESTWFSCSPTAGSTTKEKSTVVITVNRKQMEKGTYRQTFSIASNGGSEDITVTMEVASVNLSYEPLELDFGKLASSLPLTLTNPGSKTIDYTVETLNNWIIPEKASGKITTTDRLNVLVSRESLAPGEHNGSLIIKAGSDTYAVPVKMTIASNSVPIVSINSISNITLSGATISGLIADVGASEIKRHGFCLSTSPEPTINDRFFNLGNFSGSSKAFTQAITDLQTETEYFVRAYAENANGSSYSEQISFTTSGVPVSYVLLNKTSLSLPVGKTEQLISTVLPSNASNKDVIWTSSAPSVATVSSTGLVTGMSNGQAIITVSTIDGNIKTNCSVNVTTQSIPVTEVLLNKTNLSLVTGTTEQLTATVLPENAANKEVTWESSNPSVATISSTGLVRGITNGSTTITVTTADGNKKATCEVTVTIAPIAVTGVSLNKTNLALTIGDTEQLTTTILPANATNKDVTWVSSTPSVVTVSSTGLVMGIANGTATITVTTADGNKKASCDVTVSITTATIPVTGVSLNKTSFSLGIGSTEQLAATVLPIDATNKEVTWTSSTPSVATVLSTGLVTGISTGSATITVMTADGNKKATCDVTVFIPTIPVTGVSLNKTNLALKPGTTAQLTATVSPSNASNKTVSWECSNTNVASISVNGLVTGKTEGTATILVKTQDENKTAICALTVSNIITGKAGVLTWTLANGTLTISGTGAMPNYNLGGSNAPWHNYSQSISNIITESGVTNIGDCAFYPSYSYPPSDNLKSVTISNTVTKIGSYAFYNRSSLESITIPNSVTDIGPGAFEKCALITVVIPDNVKTINSFTFEDCQFLQTVTIGASVTTINLYAFSGCQSLQTVTIGASVTTINSYAFSNCRNLIKVFIKNPNPPTLSKASGGYYYYTFEGTPIDKATLVVPKGSKAAYQNAAGWSDFGTIIEE